MEEPSGSAEGPSGSKRLKPSAKKRLDIRENNRLLNRENSMLMNQLLCERDEAKRDRDRLREEHSRDLVTIADIRAQEKAGHDAEVQRLTARLAEAERENERLRSERRGGSGTS